MARPEDPIADRIEMTTIAMRHSRKRLKKLEKRRQIPSKKEAVEIIEEVIEVMDLAQQAYKDWLEDIVKNWPED